MLTVPEFTPVTTPAPSTLATRLLLLLQTPPAVALFCEMVCEMHTPETPVMAATTGSAFTVKLIVLAFEQLFVFITV